MINMKLIGIIKVQQLKTNYRDKLGIEIGLSISCDEPSPIFWETTCW